MYHYIYSVRYLLIYKNNNADEKNEEDEKDKDSDEENWKAEKINKNEETEDDNEYHTVLENMIIWKYNNKLNKCISRLSLSQKIKINELSQKFLIFSN